MVKGAIDFSYKTQDGIRLISLFLFFFTLEITVPERTTTAF